MSRIMSLMEIIQAPGCSTWRDVLSPIPFVCFFIHSIVHPPNFSPRSNLNPIDKYINASSHCPNPANIQNLLFFASKLTQANFLAFFQLRIESEGVECEEVDIYTTFWRWTLEEKLCVNILVGYPRVGFRV